MRFFSWNRRWAHSLLVVGMLGACSSSSSNKSPSDKCNDLADAVCGRGIQCIPGGAGMQQACLDAVKPALMCDQVKSVSATYDTCMTQINQDSCATLFPTDTSGDPMLVLPDPCMGVLLKIGPAAPGAEARSASDFADIASAVITTSP